MFYGLGKRHLHPVQQMRVRLSDTRPRQARTQSGQHGAAAAVATTGERERAFFIVRRQNAGRQRHRLLVDLRRQSAGDVLETDSGRSRRHAIVFGIAEEWPGLSGND